MLLLAVLGCSGKSRPPGDASTAATLGDAAVAARADAASSDAAPRPPAASPTSGEVQVRVEWKDVPVVARTSPGPTPCATARGAAVVPTTTWGIPDVLVFVTGASSASAARVVLADCALSPRLAAARAVELVSAVDRPARVTLTRRGATVSVLAGTLDAKAAAQAVRLSIAGHGVALALEADAVYELATVDPDPETAWIATGAAGTTDAAGLATIPDVAPGSHVVTAWLPPRAGRPARIARGTVEVTAGAVGELTLQLE